MAAITVSGSAYGSIKNDIIFGHLSPGAKLKLEALKERYDVSVSILREILNRLASEGFAVAEEQRGFFVAPVSAEDLIEIANLRILLESHALGESIKTGDAEWEADVVAAHHKLSRVEKLMLTDDENYKEQWKRCDWEFHQATISACNSKNLLALHSTVFDKYLRYQMLVLTFRGENAADEHADMLKAVLDRDIRAARNILKTHIEKGLKDSMSVF